MQLGWGGSGARGGKGVGRREARVVAVRACSGWATCGTLARARHEDPSPMEHRCDSPPAQTHAHLRWMPSEGYWKSSSTHWSTNPALRDMTTAQRVWLVAMEVT